MPPGGGIWEILVNPPGANRLLAASPSHLMLSATTRNSCMDPAWYRTFFDGITVDFWRDACTPEWTKSDVDLAWRELNLKDGVGVLDCPCGHGRHSLELARRGCRVTGIDISEYSLKLARESAQAAGLKHAPTGIDHGTPFVRCMESRTEW